LEYSWAWAQLRFPPGRNNHLREANRRQPAADMGPKKSQVWRARWAFWTLAKNLLARPWQAQATAREREKPGPLPQCKQRPGGQNRDKKSRNGKFYQA